MQFNFSGKSIKLSNNVLIVNGKRINLDELTTDKQITIVLEGNVDHLEVDVCDRIEVKGSAGSVETTNGDVRCGDVTGDVSTTNGDVTAKNIKGDVSTVNGDIDRG